MRLADEKMRDVSVGPKDSWAIGSDVSPYERMQGIAGNAFHDLYAINVSSGERKLVQTKVPGDSATASRVAKARPKRTNDRRLIMDFN